MPLKQTAAQEQIDIDAATEMLGEPVELGIWLARYRHRWFHDLSTGTELDLVFVVLALPVILWRWMARRSEGRKKKTGPVYAALMDDGIVFFAGSDGIFRRHITHVEDRKNFDDVTGIEIDNAKQAQVHFVCVNSPDVMLYYEGPRLVLEEFVSRST